MNMLGYMDEAEWYHIVNRMTYSAHFANKVKNPSRPLMHGPDKIGYRKIIKITTVFEDLKDLVYRQVDCILESLRKGAAVVESLGS